jgi:hypothetical protein
MDEDRLIKRTQLRRMAQAGRVLGTPEGAEAAEYNEEAFDDTDFYQLLLKDVVASTGEPHRDPSGAA